MVSFCIGLAERVISIVCNYSETKEFCRDYIVQDAVDAEIYVEVTLNDILTERKKAVREYGDDAVQFTDGYLETLAVYRQIASKMPEYDTILFHGSVIAVDDEGYLFTALSGTGKSTHTRLWREHFGERSYMVNDDKPLLRILEDGQVIAYGTPWNGKHKLGRNVGVPLRGLTLLTRGKRNRIQTISKEEAFAVFYQQMHRPTKQSETIAKSLQILNRVMELPLWRLECDISEEAVKVSYNGMKYGEEVR